MKAVVLHVIFVLATTFPSAWGQQAGGKQSLGLSVTYAPTSSNILIDSAEKRQIWTGGFEYTHSIWTPRLISVDYVGSFSPLFQERDPTLIGTTQILVGQLFITSIPPVRVIYLSKAPIGTSISGSGPGSPIYALYGNETNYAVAVAQLGSRVAFLPGRRLQPTFLGDLGLVLSSRDLVVDNSARFNYSFSFGPGIQMIVHERNIVRFEYLFRHISSANSGVNNPGIDQGVFRLTFSRTR